MNGRPPLRVYTRAQLETLPDPQWLVHDLIQTESSLIVYGDSGIGKTFFVLDLCLCIATGTPWHGHAVRKGPVLYLSPEGSSGIKIRVAAWEAKHGVRADDFFFIADGPQLHDKIDQGRLLDAVEKLKSPPAMIVIDTLARHFVGGGENDSKDMGMVIAALEPVRKQFHCTSAIVHHTAKGTNDLRGSGSLRGSADTIILAKQVQKAVIELRCEKQKESSEFAAMLFRLAPAHVLRSNGEALATCVVEPATRSSSLSTLKSQFILQRGATPLTKNGESILRVFGMAATSTSLRKAQIETASGVPPGSSGRSLEALIQADLLEREDHGMYRLTDKGKSLAAEIVGNTVKNIDDRSNIDRDQMEIDHQSSPLG